MSGRPLRYAVVGKKKVLARRRAVVVECLGKLGIRMDAAGKGTPKQRRPSGAQTSGLRLFGAEGAEGVLWGGGSSGAWIREAG